MPSLGFAWILSLFADKLKHYSVIFWECDAIISLVKKRDVRKLVEKERAKNILGWTGTEDVETHDRHLNSKLTIWMGSFHWNASGIRGRPKLTHESEHNVVERNTNCLLLSFPCIYTHTVVGRRLLLFQMECYFVKEFCSDLLLHFPKGRWLH